MASETTCAKSITSSKTTALLEGFRENRQCSWKFEESILKQTGYPRGCIAEKKFARTNLHIHFVSISANLAKLESE